MSRRRAGLDGWGQAEQLRLRASREHAGHSMQECAEILRSEFGVAGVSQPNVSRWESGAIAVPQCVGALLAYCNAYGSGAVGPHTGSSDESVGRAIVRSVANAVRAQSAGSEADTFEMLVAQATGESLLGTAQLELVRGMSRRLEHGPPLSSEDRATYLDQLRILRVVGGGGSD